MHVDSVIRIRKKFPSNVRCPQCRSPSIWQCDPADSQSSLQYNDTSLFQISIKERRGVTPHGNRLRTQIITVKAEGIWRCPNNVGGDQVL